ncbi:hypothetical protein LCGC14_1196360 [marine sediment metagenome]|uniref:Uncharacterized protein n=1 Tax=marine sediment metagenome TaxID=412755 RepID=A0A0F9PN80_9ZZZZ
MTTKYKNEQLMKFLTIIGAVVGLFTLIFGLAGLENYGFVGGIRVLNAIVTFIIGMVIVVLTFLVGLRPDEPLPFHWLVLFILGVLLIVFGAGIWACVLLIIAGLIGLIEDL